MIEFTQEELKKVEEYKSKFPVGKHKSALMPVLHMAQEKFGWCSPEVMDYVAEILDLKPIEVYEVATFYTMFHLKPVGKYVFEICRTSPCCLKGAESIIDYLCNKLNIQIGQTTPDGLFTIKTVECLAACGMAPMLQLGDKYIENLTEEKIDDLIEELRSKADERNPILWKTVFN